MIIISSQIGLHENVVALDYDSEYADLIVNHNLSYETVTLEQGGKGYLYYIIQKERITSNHCRKISQKTLFKKMLKQLHKESMAYVWCKQS